MNIALLEPFFVGSHKAWAESYQQSSQHNVDIYAMPGKYWKWRMHGGAVQLASDFLVTSKQPDLFLATDMLDVTTFLALTRKESSRIPLALYFHENQLTYPWSETDEDIKTGRDNHYGFINYSSALAADHLLFNSNYHLEVFNKSLGPFLQQFPDAKTLDKLDGIRAKSKVLYLGVDLKRFDAFKQEIKQAESAKKEAIILWNHRWEYDKNPELFFETLFRLKADGIKFKVILLGESYKRKPKIFEAAQNHLADEIIHVGYADKFATYAQLLWEADIIPVTSNQDFFGASIVEAIHCNCFPILPNRLAFPEHIPLDKRDTHLFDDKEALYKKLKACILNIEKIRSESYQNFVAHYEWSILAKEYDDYFNQITLQT